MKTIKLIVLCLSLFLVSHSTFAQLSEKQIKYNKTLTEYNDSIQKHKEKVQILKVIDNRIASSSLSVQEKNDLIAQRNIRYKKIKTLEQNIQKLDSTLKVLKYQIDIEKGLKENLGGIPIQNERQEIQEWTEDLYARKISPAEYQRRVEEILFKRSEIFINIQRYNSEIANYDSQIANYDSEMTNIKERLSSKVLEITKLKVNINNMQKNPNNPYAFSNAVNTIYQKEKGKPLSKSTREEIQQTYDVAADIYADKASKKENLESKKENLESEKEKAKKEYDELQKALDSLNNLCPDCKQ